MLQMSKQDILTTFITELIQSISTATKEGVIIIDTLLIRYDQFIVIPTVGSHIYTAFHNILAYNLVTEQAFCSCFKRKR